MPKQLSTLKKGPRDINDAETLAVGAEAASKIYGTYDGYLPQESKLQTKKVC